MSTARKDSDYLNGVPEMLLLRLLAREPMHGYDLVQSAGPIGVVNRIHMGAGPARGMVSTVPAPVWLGAGITGDRPGRGRCPPVPNRSQEPGGRFCWMSSGAFGTGVIVLEYRDSAPGLAITRKIVKDSIRSAPRARRCRTGTDVSRSMTDRILNVRNGGQ
jgi:hypothetical protein